MTAGRSLTLEVLGGPLDGTPITLESDTEWSRVGETPLTFPWDTELGDPQARFTIEEDRWYLEGLDSSHGTYRVNHEERVTKKVRLASQDILKASNTWLLVR